MPQLDNRLDVWACAMRNRKRNRFSPFSCRKNVIRFGDVGRRRCRRYRKPVLRTHRWKPQETRTDNQNLIVLCNSVPDTWNGQKKKQNSPVDAISARKSELSTGVASAGRIGRLPRDCGTTKTRNRALKIRIRYRRIETTEIRFYFQSRKNANDVSVSVKHS